MWNERGVRVIVGVASLAFVSGCDRSAGSSSETSVAARAAPTATRPPRSDDPLLEGETCTRTDDCPRTARCVDGHCVPITRSLQGEVLAERATRALATSRFQDGADAFRAAEIAFRERQLPVPSSVSCGLARALIGLNDRGGTADAREQMARALATCLAAAPAGSAMADQAVAGLASLSERGLEPGALDRSDAALMTGHDPRPTAGNTRVHVTFTGTAEGSRQLLRAAVQSEPVRQELVRCFLQWWANSHQSSDRGTLRVAFQHGVDDYDELAAPRVTVTPADLPPLQLGADAGSDVHWLQCGASAVQTAVAGLRWPARQEHWVESMLVTVSPE